MIQPGSFAATQVGFDEATALAEAARCFRCDAVYADPAVDVRAGRGPDVPGHPVAPPPPVTQHESYDSTGGTR